MQTNGLRKEPAMIEFAAGERAAMGYLALPEGRGPGVVVLHAWWGLTEVLRPGAWGSTHSLVVLHTLLNELLAADERHERLRERRDVKQK